MGGSSGKALRGTIGQQIFDQVERLTSAGQMKRTAAIQEVAKQSGRQPATVAANYYASPGSAGWRCDRASLQEARGRQVGAPRVCWNRLRR